MSEFTVGERVRVSSALYGTTGPGVVTFVRTPDEGDSGVLILVDLDQKPGTMGSTTGQPGIWFVPSEVTHA